MRRTVDQLGHVTLKDYDKAGRVISIQHPGRAAWTPGNDGGSTVQLTDFYAHDGLGRRIQHWNSQFGAAHKERTDYDREGRVVSQTDFEGRATTYSWEWQTGLTTVGLGAFGGWVKTVLHASGKTGVERLDSFGRLIGKTDLGGRVTAHGFDLGGRQITQTATGGALAVDQSLSFAWLNTGLMARHADLASGGITADYAHDALGRRVRERQASGSVVHQDGWAEYDALGRLTRFEDRSDDASDPVRTVWTHDLNGNVRSTQSNWRSVDAAPGSPTAAGAAAWNRYDALDRMVHVEGTLTDGQITLGRRLEYDARGQRVRMITDTSVQTDIQNGTVAVWVPEPDPETGQIPPETVEGEGPGHWEYHPTYETRPGQAIEHYDHTADGHLARVGRTLDEWDTTTDAVVRPAVDWRSHDVRDAVGRLVSRWETSRVRADAPQIQTHTRTAQYDRTGLVVSQTDLTYVDDDPWTNTDAHFRTETSTYSYLEGGAWRGVVTGVTTSGTRDAWPHGGSTTPLAGTSTTYAHAWGDEARLTLITRDADTGSGSNALHASAFVHDANGRVKTVTIDDDRDRTVTFVTDAQGQVLRRTEQDDTTHQDPMDRWWHFNGARIGEVTNNGDYTSTYLGAMAARAQAAPLTPTPFRHGNARPHKSLLHSPPTSRDLPRRGGSGHGRGSVVEPAQPDAVGGPDHRLAGGGRGHDRGPGHQHLAGGDPAPGNDAEPHSQTAGRRAGLDRHRTLDDRADDQFRGGGDPHDPGHRMIAGTEAFTAWIETAWLLSLRVGPVLAFAPPFTLVAVPALVRLLLGLGLSGLMAAALPPPELPGSAGALAVAAGGELTVGLTFVLALQVAFAAIQTAGRVVDIQVGFGLAALLDPTTRSQTPLLGTIYIYAAGAVFFAMNGHLELVRIMAATLETVPIGGTATPSGIGPLAALLGATFTTGLGVAGGAVLALFLADVGIALLSRTAPQMNVLVLGFQVKTLILMLVMPLTLGVTTALLARLASLTLESLPVLLL